MDRPWTAEIAVGAAQAAALVDDQFPQLSPVSAEPLRAGWDNTVFRVNTRFVFRFPRREIAVPLIETERRCLAFLAPRLPVAIPVPVFAGQPSATYPWPFAGYHYLPGACAARGTSGPAWRKRIAAPIAEFLRALHAIDPADLPVDAISFDRLDRLNARKWRALTESRLAHLVSAGAIADSGPVLAILDEAPESPAAERQVVAHGDLHAGQLLLKENDGLAGVIDWGDVHLGHAAVDLAAVHQLLPVPLHDAFLRSYGPVDPAMWQLAKARAAWHAVALLASSLDDEDREGAAEAQTALAFITEG